MHFAPNSSPYQEHFQQYLRQRASAIDPEEEHNRADRLDAVEAGDGDDDDDDNSFASITTGVCQSSVFVTPYAGVGPMVMSTAKQVTLGKKCMVYAYHLNLKATCCTCVDCTQHRYHAAKHDSFLTNYRVLLSSVVCVVPSNVNSCQAMLSSLCCVSALVGDCSLEGL